jgi:hypothetical protein
MYGCEPFWDVFFNSILPNETVCELQVKNESDKEIYVSYYMQSYSYLKSIGITNKDSLWSLELLPIYDVKDHFTRSIYMPPVPFDSKKGLTWGDFYKKYCIDSITVMIADTPSKIEMWEKEQEDSLLLKRIDLTLDSMTISSHFKIICYP